MRRPRLGLVASALFTLASVPAEAQEGCRFVEGSGNLQTVEVGGNPITYVSTPNLVCRDGVRIRADSAAAYRSSNYVQLIGRVRFEDADRRLVATRAEYFSAVDRLQAHGSVELTQKADGSVVRGDELIYHRSGPGRAREQLDVSGDRPTARLYVRPRSPGDTVAPAADEALVPYDVEADRILLEGDDYFRATGRVEIEREGMRAFGDSVTYDQTGGTLQLSERARMLLDDREITARVIRLRMPGEVLREVEARHRAVLTGEDVELRAPLVRIFFDDAGRMERLVAVPMPPVAAGVVDLAAVAPPDEADRVRPVATAREFRIVADSLDLLAPDEVLQRIQAVGGGHAESSARDSLNTADTPAVARTDWIEGDTVVAEFVQTSPSPRVEPDSARDAYRLDRLTALGSARSLYRMEANDSARARGDTRPAIHYVTATTIVIEMKGGEIRSMDVQGQTEGVHVEPTGGAPADPVAEDSAGTPATEGGAVGRGPLRPSGPTTTLVGARGRGWGRARPVAYGDLAALGSPSVAR